MARLFGTDGVRGIANKELTSELAMNIGAACAEVLTKNKKNVTVIIGNDGRESADMLVSSLIGGFTKAGVNVMNIGIIPTPDISYLISKYKMDAGVMVTASHNPYQYNGIKIFDSNGYKLPDDLEDEIEMHINNKISYNSTEIGRLIDSKDAKKDYVDYLLNTSKYNLSKHFSTYIYLNDSIKNTLNLKETLIEDYSFLLSNNFDIIEFNIKGSDDYYSTKYTLSYDGYNYIWK